MSGLWQKGKTKVESTVRLRDGPGRDLPKTGGEQQLRKSKRNPAAYPDAAPNPSPGPCTWCSFCDYCIHLHQHPNGVRKLCGHWKYANRVTNQNPSHASVCPGSSANHQAGLPQTPQNQFPVQSPWYGNAPQMQGQYAGSMSGSPPQAQGQYSSPPHQQYQQSPSPQSAAYQNQAPPQGSSYSSYESAPAQHSPGTTRSLPFEEYAYPTQQQPQYGDSSQYNQYTYSREPAPQLNRASTWASPDSTGMYCQHCHTILQSDGRCNTYNCPGG